MFKESDKGKRDVILIHVSLANLCESNQLYKEKYKKRMEVTHPMKRECFCI